MEFNTLIPIWSIFLGMATGSFLNVCIHRIPNGKSIIFPGSSCIKCGNSLKWYDNIPILSYLMLHGRCRRCRCNISIRYVLVELFTGLITAGLLYKLFFLGDKSLSVVIIYILLAHMLIVITCIDLEYMIIPNCLTYPGMAVIFTLSIILPGVFEETGSIVGDGNTIIDGRVQSLLYSLYGFFVSGGIVYITAIAGRLVFKKESMGIGDVKLMCMAGGIIGWKLGVVVFFVAPFFGLLMAIPMKVIKNVQLIPYAPFLSFAILLVIFFQDFFTAYVDMYIDVIKYLL